MNAPDSRSATQSWLERSPPAVLVLWALIAAFCTYGCMYAFRKPFAVGTFEGMVAGLSWKTVLITSQVLGYCTSKFIGIKVVSEMAPERRAVSILGLIGFSWVGLVAFGLLPQPWSAVGLFLNGLPLGMVWGLVFAFLEGRRSSDLLGAGLCTSFIVASGFVKTVGRYVLEAGVPEHWMPAVTGLLFGGPLLVFVWMLAQVPPPSAEEQATRTRRAPMDGAARRAFLVANGPGIAALTVGYMALTAYRDFRDNFARELWDALGWAESPAILTAAELPVALGSLAAVAAIYLVSDSKRALALIHAMLVLGALLVGASTLAMQLGLLPPALWMVAVGLGLYVAYVPFNCVLFDRMLAALGTVGTAAFLITFTDAFGYLASVLLLFVKDFGELQVSWLGFFTALSYATAVLASGTWLASGVFFAQRKT